MVQLDFCNKIVSSFRQFNLCHKQRVILDLRTSLISGSTNHFSRHTDIDADTYTCHSWYHHIWNWTNRKENALDSTSLFICFKFISIACIKTIVMGHLWSKPCTQLTKKDTEMCSIFLLMCNENWSILRSSFFFFLVGCLIFKASNFCVSVHIGSIRLFFFSHQSSNEWDLRFLIQLLFTLLTYSIGWLDKFFLWRHSFFVWIQMSAVAGIRYSCEKKKKYHQKRKQKLWCFSSDDFSCCSTKKKRCRSKHCEMRFIHSCQKKKILWQYNTFRTIFYLNPSNHIYYGLVARYIHEWRHTFFVLLRNLSCLWIPLNLQRKPTKLNAYIYKKKICILI